MNTIRDNITPEVQEKLEAASKMIDDLNAQASQDPPEGYMSVVHVLNKIQESLEKMKK